MKNIILTLIFAFVVNVIFAQTYEWVKQIGANEDDQLTDMAFDSLGNLYITGWFHGTVDFDLGIGTYNLNGCGDIDQAAAFIAKYDSAGNFIWAKEFYNNVPGYAEVMSYTIALDAFGNIYTAGGFIGSVPIDFDPGVNSFDLTSPLPNSMTIINVMTDIFISKLDNNGNFIWAKQIGDTLYDRATDIELDALGNVYTTGYFTGTSDFDPGVGTYVLNALTSTTKCAFICKLDAGGNFVGASHLQGNNTWSEGTGIELDNLNNIYVTGTFNGTTDFDPSVNTYNLTQSGSRSTYVLKLDSMTNFEWVKQIGGTNFTYADGVELDALGNIHVLGHFNGSTDLDPSINTFNITSNGSWDYFAVKLDNSGNFVWGKQFGGSGQDGGGKNASFDAWGNVYLSVGCIGTMDFDPGIGTYNLTSVGYWDFAIVKLDAMGNFVWAKRLGGDINDGAEVYMNDKGNIYLGGNFDSSFDFEIPIGIDTVNLVSTGGEVGKYDIFILKMDICEIFDTITNSACNSYTLNGQTYTSTGTYFQTFAHTEECDSILILNLSINNSTGNFSQTACDTYTLNGQTYTSSGVYSQTLINSAGCDSVLTLNLTINGSTNSTFTQTACKYYIFNGQTYISSGTYTQTLINTSGCDSIITLNLTINPGPNTNVTQSGANLSSNATSATYQWLDCNGYVPIVGATSQTFTPSMNGNYAVIVTENSCSDTSSCYLVTGLSVEGDDLIKDVTIYPNPSDGVFIVNAPNMKGAELQIVICDVSGRRVYESILIGTDKDIEVITPLASGLYMLYLQDKQTGARVVKRVTIRN